MKIRKKRIFLVLLGLAVLSALFVWISHSTIEGYGEWVYRDVDEVPKRRVALILGTSKIAFGRPNLFYEYRLDAAEALYARGKVDRFLVSGDNSRKEYNEPEDMKKDLVARGIPEEIIVCDFAGFSTLDSVVRAKEVFGQTEILVVSQDFHCRRALFIARNHGIDAIGFAASDVEGLVAQKTYQREYLARAKAIVDVKLFDCGPKFLGDKVVID